MARGGPLTSPPIVAIARNGLSSITVADKRRARWTEAAITATAAAAAMIPSSDAADLASTLALQRRLRRRRRCHCHLHRLPRRLLCPAALASFITIDMLKRIKKYIDGTDSPESSPSATGRCPGLRSTSEVGGVRLPMGPAFGPIVYELSST